MHQVRAGRLRQGEAVRGNRLVHSKLLDCNLQLIVIAGPGDVNLPRVAGSSRGLPVCIAHVRSHLASGAKILNSGDTQVAAVEPYFLRDFPAGYWMLRTRLLI